MHNRRRKNLAQGKQDPLLLTPGIKAEKDESGEVVMWNLEKMFGFIKPKHGGEDIFFHVTGLFQRNTYSDIAEGARVTFRRSLKTDGRIFAEGVVLTDSKISLPKFSINEEYPGLLLWYDPSRGFGFVKLDCGEEVFLSKTILGKVDIDKDSRLEEIDVNVNISPSRKHPGKFTVTKINFFNEK